MAALGPMIEQMKKTLGPGDGASDTAQEAVSDDMSMAMMQYMPLRGLLSFAGDQVSDDTLDKLLQSLNG